MTSNYERNHSHTHCWNQGDRPACGITLEKHKQCCLCDTSMTSQTWEQEFDKYYTEYNHNKMVYEISQPISGVKGFIEKLLSQQRKEIVEWSKELIGKHNARILNEFQKQGKADMPFIAYDERVCLIPAITIAMEETESDIITKLSSEKV